MKHRENIILDRIVAICTIITLLTISVCTVLLTRYYTNAELQRLEIEDMHNSVILNEKFILDEYGTLE